MAARLPFSVSPKILTKPVFLNLRVTAVELEDLIEEDLVQFHFPKDSSCHLKPIPKVVSWERDLIKCQQLIFGTRQMDNIPSCTE
jgi:hypothetical protein